jgi:hypothetical protein
MRSVAKVSSKRTNLAILLSSSQECGDDARMATTVKNSKEN